jgi:small subunit ribosomal protein S16
MSVVIRLSRKGQRNRPFYRIVAAEKQFRRDGKFLEVLGTYNPLCEPSQVTLNAERVRYWLSVGALPSDKVAKFFSSSIPGEWEAMCEAKKSKIQARRKARKQRIAIQ